MREIICLFLREPACTFFVRSFVRLLVRSFVYFFSIWFAAMPRIPPNLVNAGGVTCRIGYSLFANTPKSEWEGVSFFSVGVE